MPQTPDLTALLKLRASDRLLYLSYLPDSHSLLLLTRDDLSLFDLQSGVLHPLPPLPRVIHDKLALPSFDASFLALAFTKRRPKYDTLHTLNFELTLLPQ